jgi:hypothetical protein
MSCTNCGKKATHGMKWKEPLHCKLHAEDSEISVKYKCTNENCTLATKKEDTMCNNCTLSLLGDTNNIDIMEIKEIGKVREPRITSDSSIASSISIDSNASFDINIPGSTNILLEDYKEVSRDIMVYEQLKNIEQTIMDKLNKLDEKMSHMQLNISVSEEKDVSNDLDINKYIEKPIMDSKVLINVLMTNNAIWSVKGFMNEKDPVCVNLMNDIKKPNVSNMRSISDVFTRHGFTMIQQKSMRSKEYYRTRDIQQPLDEIIYDTIYEKNIS